MRTTVATVSSSTVREAEVQEVRLLAHVAVPDHEVLAEGEVAPERREREAELADVVEVRAR